MQRYKLVLEYVGTGLFGWQRQQSTPLTVQQIVEEAVSAFCGKDVQVTGSGRTDAGVHAIHQVAHVDLPQRIDKQSGAVVDPHSPLTVKKALAHFLRGERIGILDVEAVPAHFHARYHTLERQYTYVVAADNAASIEGSVFLKNSAWWIKEKLDVQAMNEAAEKFLGVHDFTSFRSADCQSASAIKTLSGLTVQENSLPPSLQRIYTGQSQQIISIHARAPSFLQHQVRMLTSTLVAVGRGRLTPKDIPKLLSARTNTLLPSPSVCPADGLYLSNVTYPPLDELPALLVKPPSSS